MKITVVAIAVLFTGLVAARADTRGTSKTSKAQRAPADVPTVEIGCQEEGLNCVSYPYFSYRYVGGTKIVVPACSAKAKVVSAPTLNFCP